MKRRWIAAAAMVVAAMSATPVSAQEKEPPPPTVRDWIAKCRATDNRMDCALGLTVLDIMLATDYCPPQLDAGDGNALADTVYQRRIVPMVAWLEARPELNDSSEVVGLRAAGQAIWPCPPKGSASSERGTRRRQRLEKVRDDHREAEGYNQRRTRALWSR